MLRVGIGTSEYERRDAFTVFKGVGTLSTVLVARQMLGSAERVQGGFFSSEVDDDPEETVWNGRADGLTAVSGTDGRPSLGPHARLNGLS